MVLAKVRQIAYEWETRRKNQQWIDSLRMHLKTSEPTLIVHQMGRAGSMTTVNSLRDAGITYPVYHTHWLHPDSIAERLRWLKDVPENRHPLNVRVARLIADEIQAVGTSQRSWKLVTVFREPVGRNISTFFLTIENFIEDYFSRYEQGEIGFDQMLDIFIKEYRHERPLQWFDKEVNDVFGLDVYDHPFPHDAGYQIIRKGSVELLLIKLEKLNDCFQAAFREFLGVEIPNLSMTHITEEDPTFSMYKAFIQNVAMPQSYLDQMYDSRFAKHFYGQEEIEALKKKWSRSN